MMVLELAVVAGETRSLILSKSKSQSKLLIDHSMVKNLLVATKIEEIEIFQSCLEQVTVDLQDASNLLWMLVTSMLVCNTEDNVGPVTLTVNTARDQTESAT
jgi:hypothetical protein